MATLQPQSRARYRREKEAFFKTSPHSPVAGQDFAGLVYFPEDARFRVEGRMGLLENPTPTALQSSSGEPETFMHLGALHFSLLGEACSLQAYRPLFAEDRLFIPFLDATSGRETYAAGRYLEASAPQPGAHTVILDFNDAYQPYCLYSPRYRCPLPPANNRLSVAVRAGERLAEEAPA